MKGRTKVRQKRAPFKVGDKVQIVYGAYYGGVTRVTGVTYTGTSWLISTEVPGPPYYALHLNKLEE